MNGSSDINITKRITSFTKHITAEGSRLSVTYSLIDMHGNILSANNRFDLVVIDESIQLAIDEIEEFLELKLQQRGD